MIAAAPANPPYSEKDSSCEVLGFEPELGDALCLRLPLECEWVTGAQETFVAGLVAGTHDAVLAALPTDIDLARAWP